MQQLFAPWRFSYLSNTTPTSECVFCAALRGGSESLRIWTGERAFALLNRYPYTSGHVMVAPVAHVAEYASLDAETLLEMMRISQRVVRAVQEVYHPHGFNVGANLGEAAGAGIADHLHLHVVPRWRGDTNFMPVVGQVRVIPEDLTKTQEKLIGALEAIDG